MNASTGNIKKIILTLIDMGVTPYIYTEGLYRTQPHHFEDVDMSKAKRVLGNTAVIR